MGSSCVAPRSTANIYAYLPIIYNKVYISLARHCKHLLVVVYTSLSRTRGWVSLSLYLSPLYIYIYIYMYIPLSLYIYIYIYIYTYAVWPPDDGSGEAARGLARSLLATRDPQVAIIVIMVIIIIIVIMIMIMIIIVL